MGMASLEPMREELREREREEAKRCEPAADRMLPINPLEPLAKEDVDRIQQSVVVFPTGRGKVAAISSLGGPDLALALMAGAQLPMPPPSERVMPDHRKTRSHVKPTSAERRAARFATGRLRLVDGRIVGG